MANNLINRYFPSEYFSYRNIITALLATISWSFVSMALFIPPLRWILQKYALQPGSGPTKEQIEKGGFECQFIGEACIEVSLNKKYSGSINQITLI